MPQAICDSVLRLLHDNHWTWRELQCEMFPFISEAHLNAVVQRRLPISDLMQQRIEKVVEIKDPVSRGDQC